MQRKSILFVYDADPGLDILCSFLSTLIVGDVESIPFHSSPIAPRLEDLHATCPDFSPDIILINCPAGSENYKCYQVLQDIMKYYVNIPITWITLNPTRPEFLTDDVYCLNPSFGELAPGSGIKERIQGITTKRSAFDHFIKFLMSNEIPIPESFCSDRKLQ